MRDLSRRTLLGRVAATVPAMVVGAIPPMVSPDDALFALGERLRAAWALERAVLDTSDEAFEAAYNVCSELVHEIEVTPATTLDGLRVKALAVSWCHNGDQFDDESFGVQATTTDLRIVSSILNDLLSLGAPAAVA